LRFLGLIRTLFNSVKEMPLFTSIVVLLERVPLAPKFHHSQCPLPPAMATVQTLKPSRLELHKKFVKHVKIIVAYYFECGLTRYSYNNHVSMDFGQYLCDNGVSPHIANCTSKGSQAQPVVKNHFFLLWKGLCHFRFGSWVYTVIMLVWSTCFPLPWCQIVGYYALLEWCL
jgi:hypothetical protein